MIKTSATLAESREFVHLEKNGVGVILAVQETDCLIVSTTHFVGVGTPYIPYVARHDTHSNAMEDYYKMIGLLILEKASSRYFDNPVFADHCVYGKPNHRSAPYWERIAKGVLELYNAAIAIGERTGTDLLSVTCKELDQMTPAEVKVFVDALDYNALSDVLNRCSFACIKRTYAKYYGFSPVSTLTREQVIGYFGETKHALARAAAFKHLVV